MNYLKLLWELYRLKSNTKRSSVQIKKLQEKKLRKMLSFAYFHSDYYHQTFKQAGITESNIKSAPLSAFPTINKPQLLKHFDRLVTVKDLKQDGNMYLTSLYNFAQPLIRYRLTDSLTLEMPDNGSRYPFTRATGLLGRSNDILWFEDGKGNREFLHPLAVEGICIEELRDYQFLQTSKSSFEMLVEKSKSVSETEMRSKIIEQMNTILSENGLSYVSCRIKFVEKIRPDRSTGKKRLIVKNEESLEEAV